jgi:hypothetical protein
MGKYERIKEFQVLGFNTPEILYIRRGALVDLRIVGEFFKDCERGSIRTYSDDESKNFKCPHYPNRQIPELMELFPKIVDQYHVMLAKPVDPNDTLWCGNLVVDPDGEEVYVEAIKGPGTVRDLDRRAHDLDRKMRVSWWRAQGEPWDIVIPEAVQFPRRGVVIEWSYYRVPVGMKKRQLIFWEYRPY